MAGHRAGLWSAETSPSSLLSLFPKSVCICWLVLLTLVTDLRLQTGQEDHAHMLAEPLAPPWEKGERQTAESTMKKDRE